MQPSQQVNTNINLVMCYLRAYKQIHNLIVFVHINLLNYLLVYFSIFCRNAIIKGTGFRENSQVVTSNIRTVCFIKLDSFGIIFNITIGKKRRRTFITPFLKTLSNAVFFLNANLTESYGQ